MGLSIVVLLFAGIRWLTVTDTQIGRSDFTSSYVGGTLLRTDRDHLYDETTQARLHTQLIAPDREDNLPFVDTPPAAVLVLPVTHLSLHTAYRLWSLLQAVLVLLAVFIAARAAPWPASVSPAQRVACTLVGAGGTGLVVVLLLGQWDGVNALGLSLAYWCWRRQRYATGGALLALRAGVAQPQLGIGVGGPGVGGARPSPGS